MRIRKDPPLKLKIESVAAEYSAGVGDYGALSNNDIPLTEHIFERIAAIKNAEKNANGIMASVYDREDYFFSKHSCPDVELTLPQLAEIGRFWEPYSFAYKNNPQTQRYFSVVSGRFDPSYVSFGLHYHYLKKFWNTHKVTFMSDKNNLDILFPEVKRPDTVFHLIEGVYYDTARNVITKSEAISKCLAELYETGRDLVLKPSCEGEGRGIIFLRGDVPRENNELTLKGVDNKDYICQHKIKNHETWASYPGCDALNVARINTMNFSGTPRIISSYMKIATENMDVVNVSLGALCLRITNGGRFYRRALDFYSGTWCSKLPNGAEFAGRKLYNYDKVKEAVLMMANRLPELKAIAWDVTVDEEGDVVLIELNPSGGTEGVQLLGLHPYGNRKKMREILDEYLIRRFYYERADWEWDYWEFKDSISIHRYGGLKKEVSIPEKLRGKRVETVHTKAFTGKDLTKIVVPDNVTLIRPRAFDGCGEDCEIILPPRFSGLEIHS